VTWNLFGDLTMSNATTQNSNPTEGKAKFVFTKAGSQVLTLTNVTFAGGGLPIEVDSGATLYRRVFQAQAALSREARGAKAIPDDRR
jgi:hypothetical protein